MKPSEELKHRTKQFAIRIIQLYRALPKTDEGRILGKQILRSATSIGANYRAACRARSRAEFVAKLGIVLEETDETGFWLELMLEAGIFPAPKLRDLTQEVHQLIAIFVASIRTAKDNASNLQ